MLSAAEPEELGRSVLAYFAAQEVLFLKMFVHLANCPDPWENVQEFDDSGMRS